LLVLLPSVPYFVQKRYTVNEVIKLDIGACLRESRKKEGLSQNELAMMVGVHRNTIARYEREEISPPVVSS